MTEDRKAKYLPTREKKSVLISFRLTKSDVDWMMSFAPNPNMSIGKVARWFTLESIKK